MLPNEHTITLRQPIKVGNNDYTELKLTEPTSGQLVKASLGRTQMEQLVILVQLNAKVPMAVMDLVPQTELDEAADFLGRFGNVSPKTSST